MLRTRIRPLSLALLAIALLGPLFHLAGILTRGTALLHSEFGRLGLLYVLLALSAAASAFLSLRRGNTVVRWLAGAALLLNLGSIGCIWSSWAQDMKHAVAEIEMVSFEPSQIGILVCPANTSQAAASEARAIESIMNEMIKQTGLRELIAVHPGHPVTSEEQAKEIGQRISANVVVWKQEHGQDPIVEKHHVTVLGTDATQIMLEPFNLMLLMTTRGTLTLKDSRAPDNDDVSPLATQVTTRVATGFAFLAAGRPLLAAAQFQSASTMPDLPEAALLSIRNDYGTALLLLGRPDLALEQYELSNAVRPNAAAWVGLGNTAIARHEWDTAPSAFNKAITLDPYAPAPYCGLGIVYASKHDVRKALSSYGQAITLEPTGSIPYALLGLTYELEANIEAAHRAYKTCALYSGSNAGLHGAVLQRAEDILRNPPTAVPTATPRPIPTPAPIPTSAVYRVKSGDNLRAIADEFDVSLQAIVDLNDDLTDPDSIFVGQVLLIPPVP